MSEQHMYDLDRMEFLPVERYNHEACPCYSHGKQHRVTSRSLPPHRADNILDIVHLNV
jgi:hypothetical protein